HSPAARLATPVRRDDPPREAPAPRREGDAARPRHGTSLQGARDAVTTPPATTPRLKVADLLARKGDPLQLEVLTAEVGLEREIRSPEASSPGLVLAGYTARFLGTDRIHILGETEITYLASLDAKARRKSIETFLSY